MREEVYKFAQEMADDGYQTFADGLCTLLEENIAKIKDIRVAPLPRVVTPEMMSTNVLMMLEPTTIAMYLTYFDFDIFQRIQVRGSQRARGGRTAARSILTTTSSIVTLRRCSRQNC